MGVVMERVMLVLVGVVVGFFAWMSVVRFARKGLAVDLTGVVGFGWLSLLLVMAFLGTAPSMVGSRLEKWVEGVMPYVGGLFVGLVVVQVGQVVWTLQWLKGLL